MEWGTSKGSVHLAPGEEVCATIHPDKGNKAKRQAAKAARSRCEGLKCYCRTLAS